VTQLATKNDQVFATSLSEIAFTLVFILMLLLGFLVVQERQDREKAEGELAKVQQVRTTESATKMLDEARQKLADALKDRGVVNPAELAQAVANTGEIASERDRLRQQVFDISKKMEALEDLRAEMENAGKAHSEQITREQVEEAMQLRDEIEKMVADDRPKTSDSETNQSSNRIAVKRAVEGVKQAIVSNNELHQQVLRKLGIEVRPGEESKVIQDLVDGARAAALAGASKGKVAAVKAENEQLRTQVAFYENRDKLRGLDHPPCWMDKGSKIEYIFNVQTTQAGFVVTPGWPLHRELDAKAIAGSALILGKFGSAMSANEFNRSARPFLEEGKRQSPECRHFIYLSSTIADADRRDQSRRLANSHFYVLERKAIVQP
jgi:hypothetical protein